MGKRYTTPLFLTILWVGIIFGGCDETGSGSSDILPGEPTILDSALAINLLDDRPDGVTTSFLSGDDRIYLWLLWTNVEGRHTAGVEWFTPNQELDESPFRAEDEVFSSATGEQITWFFIDPPAGEFPAGEWRVVVYLDDLFERSHIFFVD